MKSVATQYDYYEEALKFFKPGVLNEFAYALMFKWSNFKSSCGQLDKERAAINFYNQIFALYLKDKNDLKLWSGEPYAHQIVFLELLAMGPVLIGIHQV